MDRALGSTPSNTQTWRGGACLAGGTWEVEAIESEVQDLS